MPDHSPTLCSPTSVRCYIGTVAYSLARIRTLETTDCINNITMLPVMPCRPRRCRTVRRTRPPP
eukprot:88542-Pyramimonas_sp.AAC.1